MAASVQNLINLSEESAQSRKSSSEILALKQSARRLSTAIQNQNVSEPVESQGNDMLALNDLKKILSMTAVFTPKASDTSDGQQSQKRATRRCSSIMSYDFFDSSNCNEIVLHDNPMSSGLLDDEDDWGDINVGSTPADEKNICMEGFLRLKKPNSTKYVKQYFTLSKANQLIYFSDRSEVMGHVAKAKGIIQSSDVKSILRSDIDSTIIDIICNTGTYTVHAYTLDEANDWHHALCAGLISVGDLSTIYMESGEKGDEKVEMTFDNPLMRGKRKKSMRRASVNDLKKDEPSSDLLPSAVKPREKKGYLKKDNLWVWQERWFELLDPGILSWYKKVDENGVGLESGAKGELFIRDIISVGQVEEDPCLFNIDIKGRTYKLQADSEGLAKEWCELLIEWVKFVPLAASLSGSVSDSYPVNKVEINKETLSATLLTPSNKHGNNGRRTSILLSQLKKSEDHTTDIPEAQGWIKKKMETGAWERRWLQISKPGRLQWFMTDEAATKGESLSPGVMISSILSVDLLPRDKRNFEVNIKGKTHKFQCFSEEQTTYWYESLLNWMELCSRSDLQSTHRRKSIQSTLFQCQSASKSPDMPTDVILEEGEEDEGNDNDKNNEDVKNELTSAHLPVREGKVTRNDEGCEVWQQHLWLELQLGRIAVYKKKTDVGKGVAHATEVIQVRDIIAVDLCNVNPNVFFVDVKGKTYSFNSESSARAEVWCDDILQWVIYDLTTTTSNSLRKYYKQSLLAKNIKPIGVVADGIPIEKRGMLKKEADVGRIWRKRWCEVKYPGIMRWYASESDALSDVEMAKGFIILKDVLFMSVANVVGRATFDLSIRGKTFEFQAVSIDEATKWFDSIFCWIDFALKNEQLFSNIGNEAATHAINNSNFVDGERFGIKLPEKSGPAAKKEEKSTKWRDLWLELSQPGVLAYYTQRSDITKGLNRAHGVVQMVDVISVDLHESDPHIFCITVVDQAAFFEFNTSSTESSRNWCECIQKWINYHILAKSTAGRKLYHPNCLAVSLPEMIKLSVPLRPTTCWEGSLKKRGGFGDRIWHVRWCEISPEGLLAWFARKEDAGDKDKAEGWLAMCDVISTFMDVGSNWFEVIVTGKVHVFQASDSVLAQAWLEKIDDWIVYEYLVKNPNRQGIDSLSEAVFKDRESSKLKSFSKELETVDMLSANESEVDDHELLIVENCTPEFSKEYEKSKEPERGKIIETLVEDVLHVHGGDGIQDFDTCGNSSDMKRLNQNENCLKSSVKSKPSDTSSVEGEQVEGVATDNGSDIPTRKFNIAMLPEKSGTITVKDHDSNEWRARWLEVKQPGILSFHICNESENGGIRSDESCEVQLSEVISVDVNAVQHRFFDVDIKNRTFEFEAESGEIASSWHDVVAVWVNYYIESSAKRGRNSYHRNSLRKKRSLLPSHSGETFPCPQYPGGHQNEIKGSLKMRDFTLDSWRQMWFVISHPGVLRWYKDEGSEDIADSIPLHEVVNANIDDGDVSFLIDAKGRCFEFRAQSAHDARNWFESISAWVEFACSNMSLFVSSELSTNSGKEMVGMLRRKCESKIWREQWLELREPGSLAFYAKKSDTSTGIKRANGVVQMSDVLSVEIHKENATLFDVNVPGKTYEFETQSIELTEKWYNCILMWIVDLNTAKSAKRGRRLFQRSAVINVGDDTVKKIIDEPIKARGYLKKKKVGGHGVWQQRWCEVAVPGYLKWFSNKKDAVGSSNDLSMAKGFICLNEVIALSMDTNVDVSTFDIELRGRTYNFKGASPEEAQAWFEKIFNWVDFARANQHLFDQKEESTKKLSGNEYSFLPEMSSIVMKKGGNKKKGEEKWQQRWLSMTRSGHIAYYGKRSDSSKGLSRAKGTIQLRDVLSVEINELEPSFFDVDIKGRTYTFQCDSESTALEWNNAILMWITHLSNTSANKELESPQEATETISHVAPDNAQKVKMNGYLKKQGGLFGKKWQTRWFSLAEGIVAWYDSEEQSLQGADKSKGFLQVKDILSVDQNINDECCFEICLQSRVIKLRSENKASAHAWVKKVLESVAYEENGDVQGQSSAGTNQLETVIEVEEDDEVESDEDAHSQQSTPQESLLHIEKSDGVEIDNDSTIEFRPCNNKSDKNEVEEEKSIVIEEALVQIGERSVDVAAMSMETENDVTAVGMRCFEEEEEDTEHMTDVEKEAASALVKREGTEEPEMILEMIPTDNGAKSMSAGDKLTNNQQSLAETQSSEESCVLLETDKKKKKSLMVDKLTEARLTSDEEKTVSFLEQNDDELSMEETKVIENGVEIALESKTFECEANSGIENRNCSLDKVAIDEVDAIGEEIHDNESMLQSGIGAMKDEVQSNACQKRADGNDVQLVVGKETMGDKAKAQVNNETNEKGVELAEVECGVEEIIEDVRSEVEIKNADDMELEVNHQAIEREASLVKKTDSTLHRGTATEDKKEQIDSGVETNTVAHSSESPVGVKRRILPKTKTLSVKNISEFRTDVDAFGGSGRHDMAQKRNLSPREGNVESQLCKELSVQQYYDELDGEKDGCYNSDEERQQYYDGLEVSVGKNGVDSDDDTDDAIQSEVVHDESCTRKRKSLVQLYEPLDTAEKLVDSDDDSDYQQDNLHGSAVSKLFGNYNPVPTVNESEDESTIAVNKAARQSLTIPKAWSTFGGVVDSDDDSNYCSDYSASLDSTDDESDNEGEDATLLIFRESASITKRKSKQETEERNRRRGSSTESRKFIRTNSEMKKDDFLNKLKSNSVKDLNKEFWINHKWYLTYMMCFVTLHVLYVTSFVLNEGNE